MPKCKNDPKRSYKGDEPSLKGIKDSCREIKGQSPADSKGILRQSSFSPKGLGYCAHAEKVGTKKKGRDKNMWIVVSTKSGTKRWVREKKEKTKSKTRKITLSSFYGFTPVKTINWKLLYKDLNKSEIDTMTKLKNMKNRFEKNDIKFFIVPLPRSDKGYFFVDYPWDVVREKLGNDYLDHEFVIMVIRMNDDKTLYNDEKICMQHNLFNKDSIKKVMEMLKKEFKKKLVWNGSIREAICIKL